MQELSITHHTQLPVVIVAQNDVLGVMKVDSFAREVELREAPVLSPVLDHGVQQRAAAADSRGKVVSGPA